MDAGEYLGSGIEVADGVGFEVVLILPAQHGSDDDDNEGYDRYGSQNCSNYPQVVRRALDHSWTGEKKKKQEKHPQSFYLFLFFKDTQWLHDDSWMHRVEPCRNECRAPKQGEKLHSA